MNSLIHWFWLIVLVALIGPGVSDIPVREWTSVQVYENEGVILPASDAPELLQGTGLEPVGYWYPRYEHLFAAEDALSDQSQGYRQYAGFIEDGERKIYINAFCTEPALDWKRNVVFVMDGGACFWQAIYNVSTRDVEMLIVNGEA
jgi:hypothetical protein